MTMRRIDSISRSQVSKYLGYGSNMPISEDLDLIDESIEEIKAMGQVNYIIRNFELDEGILKETNVKIPGRDSERLLKDCNKVLLMAATLGSQVDRWIQRAMIMEPARGLIRDAVASSAIETQVEQLNREYSNKLSEKNLYLTRRFSPGYGDVPISFSKKICHLLETSKNIGLHVSEYGILLPRKSITAFIGISKIPQKVDRNKCNQCDMSENCEFSRRGEQCGS